MLEAQQIAWLDEAVYGSRQRMGRAIAERAACIKEYVGSHYSEQGSAGDAPVNFLELLINILIYNLSAGDIGVSVTTNKPALKYQASVDELAVQHMVRVADLRSELGAVVREAVFAGIGLAKVGLRPIDTSDFADYGGAIGRPFSAVVTLEDAIFDMSARTWKAKDYVGNRYLCPLDWARNTDMFDAEARATLSPIVERGQTYEGADRSEKISRGGEQSTSSYREVCELEDIWCPHGGCIVTKAVGSKRALRQSYWTGPAEGMYLLLSFHDVPSQILSLSPVANIRALNNIMNNVFNTASNQAISQKDVILARMGGSEDAKRVIDAEDGQVINCDDPRNAQKFTFGGANQVNVAFFTLCKMLFPYLAGGMDSFGGLAPQADTATQEQIMRATSSKKIQAMQDRVIEFATNVVRHFAWYCRYDPFYNPTLTQRVAGTDIEVPVSYAIQDREGDFIDFNYAIQPVSIAPMSPGEKIGFIMQTMQAIAPLLPLAMQQGISIDLPALVSTLAKLRNVNELTDIFKIGVPTLDPQMEPQGKPPTTRREYVRINRPGATTQGQDETMMRTLLGGNPQGAEQAALARSVG